MDNDAPPWPPPALNPDALGQLYNQAYERAACEQGLSPAEAHQAACEALRGVPKPDAPVCPVCRYALPHPVKFYNELVIALSLRRIFHGAIPTYVLSVERRTQANDFAASVGQRQSLEDALSDAEVELGQVEELLGGDLDN